MHYVQGMADTPAQRLVARLHEYSSPQVRDQLQRYFKTGEGEYGEGDVFIGVRMGHVFQLAREFITLTPDEIDELLLSPIHEVRAAGLSIMNQQARRKRTPPERRRQLYELYLRRTDRINNWDLVDLAAPYVVGGYLAGEPRTVLYELARSTSVWERRTAIVSTLYFIRQGDLTDAFAIAELLLGDRHDLIHKAAGWALRETGRQDRAAQLAFLDKHAATMPRTMLRYAIEHLDADLRAHYRGLKLTTTPATATRRR